MPRRKIGIIEGNRERIEKITTRHNRPKQLEYLSYYDKIQIEWDEYFLPSFPRTSSIPKAKIVWGIIDHNGCVLLRSKGAQNGSE